jgi:hypothetical protein
MEANRDTSVEVKKSAKMPVVPSVAKMMETDPELKDFYKLIHENGFRDQAVVLLRERLEKRQLLS